MHTAHLHYQHIITSRVKIISESLLFPIFLYLWNLPKYISFKIVVHFGPGESSSDDAVMMNTPVVKAALEMGFSRSLVKRTVQSKILTTGENYKTVNDIVSALLNAEDEKREEEKEEEKERQTEETASGIWER